MSRIISTRELVDLQDSGRHVVLLDVRFAPGAPDLRPEYEQGHIRGAHFVDLPTQLQAAGGGTAGARPLPERAALQEQIERWGVHDDSVVVTYSDGTAGAAARAWFVLSDAGLPDVRYLDGGLAAWRASGGTVSTEEPEIGGGTAKLPEPTDRGWQLDADGIQELAAAGVVLDARKAAAYAGDGSARSGHVPGASSLPAGALLDQGRVKSADEVRELLAERGWAEGDVVGVYCGGGVAAALSTLVLREHDIDARLFVGSFSAWAADPAREVSTTPQE
jgi:thiosulfate/3-mercaptopyruvate sulfurtransferase